MEVVSKGKIGALNCLFNLIVENAKIIQREIANRNERWEIR